MRVIFGAALAALLLAAPAMAQTDPTAAAASCPTFEAAPTNLPDGATAPRADIETANTNVVAWAAAARASLECRSAAAAAARAFVQQYNADAQTLNQTTTAWEAEVVEYNARPRNRR